MTHTPFFAIDMGYRSRDVLTGDRDEDGAHLIRTIFQLVAENPTGRRIEHPTVHLNESDAQAHLDEYTGPTDEDNPRWLDMDTWYEVDPRYGSQAYCNAEPELVAAEKARDLAAEREPAKRYRCIDRQVIGKVD